MYSAVLGNTSYNFKGNGISNSDSARYFEEANMFIRCAVTASGAV